MTGIITFKVNEVKPKLLGNADNSYSTDWYPAENPEKRVKLIPTVWEYDGLFLLVSNYNCSAVGTLRMRVIAISRIKF